MNDTLRSSDTYWHVPTVTRAAREQLHGHRAFAVWFTGLSGAGKSSLAHALEARLFQMGCSTFVFDGDNVRHGLCGDLGFSQPDRVENIRRIGEMVKLFVESGVIALTAFISPFRADRSRVRELLQAGDFIEVYCRCSLDVCESRDVKGLYKKARSGQITHFTGISSPYEPPESAELVLDTGNEPLKHCVDKLIDYFQDRRFIPRDR